MTFWFSRAVQRVDKNENSEQKMLHSDTNDVLSSKVTFHYLRKLGRT